MKYDNTMQFKFKKSASCTIFELNSESKSSSTFISAPQKRAAGAIEKRQPLRMNMVQMEIEWMSLPNIKNGTVLGKIKQNYFNCLTL